jgi:outer membrane lipoprotein SlyB
MNRLNLGIAGLVAASTLAVTGCATSGYGSSGAGYGSTSPGYGSQPANCADCGVITRIEPIQTGSAAPNATGAILGGLVGAVAGRELADDESKGRQNNATVAGAAAGAVAGNAVQNSVQTKYEVYVRMNDGRTSRVTLNNVTGLQVGEPVRVSNGRIYGS